MTLVALEETLVYARVFKEPARVFRKRLGSPGYDPLDYGYDCPGNNIRIYQRRRYTHCLKSCNEEPNCVAFVVIRVNGYAQCHLKSNCDTEVPMTNSGIYTKNGPEPIDCAAVCPCPAESARCPNEWISHKQSCYKFITGNVIWETAQNNCRNLGGDSKLVALETVEEGEWVVAEARKVLNDRSEWWTGGVYCMDKKQFYWNEDCTGEPVNNALWNPGEPNGIKYRIDLLLNSGSNFNSLNDENADRTCNYVCEMAGQEAPIDCAAVCPCPAEPTD